MGVVGSHPSRPDTQAFSGVIETSCKIGAFGYTLLCTLRSAVTVSQPGRLLQQPYIASIGVASPGERMRYKVVVPTMDVCG